MNNPLIATDGYKLSHWKQYPKGTEHVYSYIEPRSGDGPVVVFGINEFVQLIRNGNTEDNVQELIDLAETYGIPVNTKGLDDLSWMYDITHEFPLLVRGLPEGSVVMPGTPIASIVNTDPDFPWLTSFFETLFLRCVWYPSTVASISRECKSIILKYLEKTGTPGEILYKLHDFGARGVSSGESAAIGGAAHLINFDGTDTLEARKYIGDRYGNTDIGHSISASEHSTVTSWKRDNEGAFMQDFYETNLGPGITAACVSDSYDIMAACDFWIAHSDRIRKTGGTLVIRPDSGHPIDTPVAVVSKLLHEGGFTVNSKGYKLLPSHLRVIQGDGITKSTIEAILAKLESLHISADNIAFGMGGGLLQHCDRDTYGWAMKCSAARVDGEWRDVYKESPGKPSKKGLVTDGVDFPEDYVLQSGWDSVSSKFVAYYDGTIGYVREPDSWEDIRQRAEV